MQTVTISYLKMTNWRTRNRTVQFNGRPAQILGQNKSGKSSVFDGFLWCLFGTDSQNRTNYHLFDDRVEQTYENAVPAEIELGMRFDEDDVVFRRVANQGWTRRRGTDTFERSGSDNYNYFIDGIEVSAKQYAEEVESYFGAPTEKLRIILNPSYFLSLNWQDQRRLLGDIIGDVKEGDFKPIYSEVFKELAKYNIGKVREKYKSLLAPEKEALRTLPHKIEALTENLPDTSEIEKTKARISEISAEIDDIDNILTNKAKAAEAFLKQSMMEARDIAALESELDVLRRQFENQKSPEAEAIEKEIAKANSFNASLVRMREDRDKEIAYYNNLIESTQKELQRRTETNDRLRQELLANKTREFTGDHCPYCGQILPDDKLEAAKAKFNANKAAEHDDIVRRGKENKAFIDGTSRTINDAKERIAELEAKVFEPLDVTHLEEKLAQISKVKPRFEDSSVFAEKVAVIEEKRANMTKVPDTSDDELVAKKQKLALERDDLLLDTTKETERKRLEESIEQLKQENKDTAVAAAKHEGFLKLLDQYERDKAQIIQQRVSKLFSYCTVQMETTDKSGNTVPTCIITDKSGVSAQVTNLEARVNCQIDLSRAFAIYYELSAPMFIDNSESINEENMPHPDCQTIVMRVTDSAFEIITE